MDRRNFLKQGLMTTAGLLGGAIPTWANQAEQDQKNLAEYDFLLPRVQFRSDSRVPDQWNIWPIGDRNLLEELQRIVNCKVKLQPGVSRGLRYGDTRHFNAVLELNQYERMCHFPMIFMTSEGEIHFNRQYRQHLKSYLEQGGFVLMDDCCYDSSGDFFFQSCVPLLRELFGREAVLPIPHDHEVFHNVHDLGAMGLPHVSGQYHEAHGLFLEGRLAAFLSSTDLHCGWSDRNHQWFRPGGRPPGNAAYKEAIEMGINIIMYAMNH